MSEIHNMKLKLQSYMDGYEDQRNQIKSEAKAVLDLLQTYESKKKALEVQKELCSDEIQVKQVLMDRIKELEGRQESKREGKFDADNQIMKSQQRQLELMGQLKLVDDQMNSISQKLKFVESQKKERVTEMMKNELSYKTMLIQGESDKNTLKQEAEELKNKLVSMVKLFESRDSQMSKIDQKIDELIRLRKEITANKENDLNSLLQFKY